MRDLMPNTDYVKAGGAHCPVCRCKTVCQNEFRVSGIYAYRQCACESCGTFWTERYSLIGYDKDSVELNEPTDEALDPALLGDSAVCTIIRALRVYQNVVDEIAPEELGDLAIDELVEALNVGNIVLSAKETKHADNPMAASIESSP